MLVPLSDTELANPVGVLSAAGPGNAIVVTKIVTAMRMVRNVAPRPSDPRGLSLTTLATQSQKPLKQFRTSRAPVTTPLKQGVNERGWARTVCKSAPFDGEYK